MMIIGFVLAMLTIADLAIEQYLDNQAIEASYDVRR